MILFLKIIIFYLTKILKYFYNIKRIDQNNIATKINFYLITEIKFNRGSNEKDLYFSNNDVDTFVVFCFFCVWRQI